jgi:hypothetical protein
MTAITVVPGLPTVALFSKDMHSSVTESVDLEAEHTVRSPVRALSVSTVNSSAMPKLAIAPMPKVPTTPAARASGVFLLLDPARQ